MTRRNCLECSKPTNKNYNSPSVDCNGMTIFGTEGSNKVLMDCPDWNYSPLVETLTVSLTKEIIYAKYCPMHKKDPLCCVTEAEVVCDKCQHFKAISREQGIIKKVECGFPREEIIAMVDLANNVK